MTVSVVRRFESACQNFAAEGHRTLRWSVRVRENERRVVAAREVSMCERACLGGRAHALRKPSPRLVRQQHRGQRVARGIARVDARERREAVREHGARGGGAVLARVPHFDGQCRADRWAWPEA